jgi:hypothetical protein
MVGQRYVVDDATPTPPGNTTATPTASAATVAS